jgi:hypothetical protein
MPDTRSTPRPDGPRTGRGARRRPAQALLSGLTGLVALSALLSLTAGPVLAQGPPPDRSGPPPERQGPPPDRAGPSPLEWLLTERERVGLTPAQVERLQEVHRALARRNDPLLDRMVMLRAEWQRERLAMQRAGLRDETPRLRQIRSRVEPVFEQIQRNNQAAMQRVNQLLTPPQRQRLRTMLQQRAGPGGADGVRLPGLTDRPPQWPAQGPGQGVQRPPGQAPGRAPGQGVQRPPGQAPGQGSGPIVPPQRPGG